MGKGKRNPPIVISSSEDDEDGHFSLKSGFISSKSAPTRKNPKRTKRVSLSNSCLRPLKPSNFSGFDEAKKFTEEFDQEFTQFKVTSGSGGSNKDLWVEKYKPSCLGELAVHKKKVEEVKIWFEERLRDAVGNSYTNVILISGGAGVGKSETVYAIARHLGVEVCEWNAPTPTLWQEHLHASNSGMRYMSKLDEFENFVERIRKYGFVSSSLTQVSPSSAILLIDDLPVVNGKVSYERLQKCLHLLVQSAFLPTAILINDSGRSESADYNGRCLEDLQLSLQNAGAFKVVFNPVTINSIKKVLSKICRKERLEASDMQIDDIAKVSGGDIRHAIMSLQYFSLKTLDMQLRFSKSLPSCTEEKENEDNLGEGVGLSYGKDATLSLFHALGKFLHNKRETGSSAPDHHAIRLKEDFVRCPLKMDAPELVLCQAHGQARVVADFLHENVLDFVSEEAIKDASVVSAYLSDSDLLLSRSTGALLWNFEAENLVQSVAASIAVRGVLFGNTCPASSRWHAIRRPMIWQVELSRNRNKCQILSQRTNMGLKNFSVMATELRPALNWLGYRAVPEEDTEDDANYNETDDDIEEW